nr:uncharacterized protein LOC113396891 [Vanessa tameamea]
MFVANLIHIALFLQLFENIQNKVIKYEEFPVSAGELTLKFVANKDPTSENIGKIFLLLREDEPGPNVAEETSVPNLVSKIGIEDGKCPAGYTWIGSFCSNIKKLNTRQIKFNKRIERKQKILLKGTE